MACPYSRVLCPPLCAAYRDDSQTHVHKRIVTCQLSVLSEQPQWSPSNRFNRTSDTECWPHRRLGWPQAGGTHLLGRVCHPVSPMNTCNLLLYPWVSRIRAHLSSTPATGMWEDAHCKLLSVSGCNVSVSRQWLHRLGDWVKMQEGEQLIYLLGEMQKGVVFFSLAINSHVTHLPYEPLGSIKVRKSVIIQKRATVLLSLSALGGTNLGPRTTVTYLKEWRKRSWQSFFVCVLQWSHWKTHIFYKPSRILTIQYVSSKAEFILCNFTKLQLRNIQALCESWLVL